jgi:collagenase-like PrtC family protease
MVEVLSPAGSWDCLKAAVDEGADAVYFGLKDYNARRRAENFEEAEVNSVVEYLHKRGAKAYLTANTLVKNHEMNGFLDFIGGAYDAGIDAVIIQELSLAEIIHEGFPGIEIHASTQTSIFNHYFKRCLEHVDRVILPREMSLKQVGEFIEKTGLDVEVFVQGALCFSISGQCRMSAFLGGRSGNRGFCAQPCRKKYNESYALSTKDLCSIEDVKSLVELGVSSLKIEGRLRSPGYVGAATALYRRLVDSGEVDRQAYEDMVLAFYRGYTRGGLNKQYDVATKDYGGKRGLRLGVLKMGGIIRIETELMVGDGVGIKTQSGMHGDYVNRIELNGKPVASACAGETIRVFLNAKGGDVLFLTSGVARRMPRGKHKREEIFLEHREGKYRLPEAAPQSFSDIRLLAKAYSKKQAFAALESGACGVFYNIFEKDHPAGDVGGYVPVGLSEWNAKRALELISSLSLKTVLCADLGVAAEVENAKVYLDVSCNAFNDIDVGYYNDMGMEPTISPELSIQEISEFSDKRFAVYAHGRMPLMSTKYKLDAEILKDELGYIFPVRKELDNKVIANSVPLGIWGEVKKLIKNDIRHYIVDLWGEPHEVVAEYRDILDGKRVLKRKGYTLGNYLRGVA